MLKALGPRLFPEAAASLYIDIKVTLPADPRGLLVTVANTPQQVALVTLPHPEADRDVFKEFLEVLRHLESRRLSGDMATRETYAASIRGHDFEDVSSLPLWMQMATSAPACASLR